MKHIYSQTTSRATASAFQRVGGCLCGRPVFDRSFSRQRHVRLASSYARHVAPDEAHGFVLAASICLDNSINKHPSLQDQTHSTAIPVQPSLSMGRSAPLLASVPR